MSLARSARDAPAPVRDAPGGAGPPLRGAGEDLAAGELRFVSVPYAWSLPGSNTTYFYAVVVFLYRWTGPP